MRVSTSLITGCIVGAFGLAILGAEKPSEEYVKAMRELGTVAEGLDKAVAAEDYATLLKYGRTAATAFTIPVDYWRGKADDARTWAETGKKAAADLAVAAGQGSATGAAFAAKEMTDTCTACHDAHREKLPDGTFQIR